MLPSYSLTTERTVKLICLSDLSSKLQGAGVIKVSVDTVRDRLLALITTSDLNFELVYTTDLENWYSLANFTGTFTVPRAYLNAKYGYYFVTARDTRKIHVFNGTDWNTYTLPDFKGVNYTLWMDEENSVIFENGTIYAPVYCYQPYTMPYVLKSTDWGATWSLWFNITEYDARANHTHAVGYDPYSGWFWISYGDTGKGEIILYPNKTIVMNMTTTGESGVGSVGFLFSEKYVWLAPDGNVYRWPISDRKFLYSLPYPQMYNVSHIAWGKYYDSEYGIYYIGVQNYTGYRGGLFASKDLVHWYPILIQDNISINDIVVYHDYVVFAEGAPGRTGKLYAIKRLSAPIFTETTVGTTYESSYLVQGDVGFDLRTTVLENAKIYLQPKINELKINDTGFETDPGQWWGYSGTKDGTGTHSVSKVSTNPYNGSYCYKLIVRMDTGTYYKLRLIYMKNITVHEKTAYTAVFFIKKNSTIGKLQLEIDYYDSDGNSLGSTVYYYLKDIVKIDQWTKTFISFNTSENAAKMYMKLVLEINTGSISNVYGKAVEMFIDEFHIYEGAALTNVSGRWMVTIGDRQYVNATEITRTFLYNSVIISSDTPLQVNITGLTKVISTNDITSISFTDQRLHVTLDAPSGTISTLTVYCGGYGEPEYIYVEPDSELVSWSYNVSTSLLTVQVKHGSPANITISWVSTSSGGVVPSKIRTQIVLDTATLSVKPNETVVVSGRLLDEFYNPIPNGKLTVTFLWNGSKITVYSDVDGRFTFTFKAPGEKGKYAVHIYFTGDTTHSSAEKIYRFYVGPPIGLPVPLNLPSLPPTQTLILTAAFATYIYLKKRRERK
ncbi:hypothetical protein DRO69_00470 [Candidatus Bathyarchaeota archaeon]|nr:MAG: hypothetical protein DRO69_00470 [Candidatus Bathyarchaeota archaeon]